MCDSIVVVGDGFVLFGKNSDRDPNEAQVLDWRPRGKHAEGSSVRCTWIEIPEVKKTHAAVLSRPFWTWGAEMGANEHGVVIGNEAVFTRSAVAPTGLTGMDLVRLGLERGDDAEDAVAVIVELLQRHGQGGGCGLEHPSFRYHNSFLIADAKEAYVLETSDRDWAVEKVARGVRGISNGLSIEPFASERGDPIRTRVAEARERRARTEDMARDIDGVAGMIAVLGDHLVGAEPRYRFANGAMSPCMHGGGMIASAQTTGSWISRLGPDGAEHWATGTAAPCTGLFKPVEIKKPIDLGAPKEAADEESLWWRHERLHRRVMRAPEALRPLFDEERIDVQAEWLADRPSSAEAFRQGDALLSTWVDKLRRAEVRDARPFWVRRYWERRNEAAGLVV